MCSDENISMDNDKVQHLLRSMTNKESLLPREDKVKTFDEIYSHLSKEEIFVEYVNFLRTFPDILDSEKTKLVDILIVFITNVAIIVLCPS